jgi:hypothetical protein
MKVDKERRLVSGFATLDNVDRQRDIVLASASREAFKNWAGNVREMHDKIAAGRLVQLQEKTYFDPDTQQMYSGIWVEVYVSKGAESTWQKVLDGTLAGFSIGGFVTEKEDVFDEDHGWITVIKAYDLAELSLVDSPANQLANVFAVLKMDSSTHEVSGIAVNVETQDVFWCSEDKLATIGSEGCSICGGSGEKVGWIETAGTAAEKAEAVAGLLKNIAAMPAVQKEEGVQEDMADETVEKAETVAVVEEVTVEKSEASDAVVATAEAGTSAPEAVAEATAEVAETTATEDFDWKAELAAMREVFSGFNTVLAGISKAVEANANSVTETNAKVEALSASLNEAVTKSAAETAEAVTALTARVGGVEKSIVVKKSADREETAPVVVQKDIWADRFTVRSL